jgi:hypothetical protein
MTYILPNVGPYVSPVPGHFNAVPNTNALPNFNTSNLLQPNVAPQKLHAAFKPKRAGKNKAHVIFVLDDSGSMQSCVEPTISGFNEYLQGQNDGNTFVTLYKFDGYRVTKIVDKMLAAEVSPLTSETYNPRGGGTNLLDSIGSVMQTINIDLSSKKKNDRESIIITVLTDGAENSSKIFSKEDIAEMITKAEAKNWGFMFLGANVDAFSVGAAIGFNVNNTLQYSTENSVGAIRSASAMTTRMKSAYAEGAATSSLYQTSAFTEQERLESSND